MTRQEAQAYLADGGTYVGLYAKIFPQWEHGFGGLPERFHGGVVRWVLFGITGGHFLSAVVNNDLFQATGRADLDALDSLPAICRFFYNYAPSGCYGSLSKAQAWEEKGGILGS